MRVGRPTETMTVQSASDRFFTGNLTIVDVRSDAEFAQARVPGATHIPLAQLRRRLPEVRSDRPIAFLCRSGHRSALATREGTAQGCRRAAEALTSATARSFGVALPWRAGGRSAPRLVECPRRSHRFPARPRGPGDHVRAHRRREDQKRGNQDHA